MITFISRIAQKKLQLTVHEETTPEISNQLPAPISIKELENMRTPENEVKFLNTKNNTYYTNINSIEEH